MVLILYRMCQCIGIMTVHWHKPVQWLIGIMRLLTAEPRSTTRLLFFSLVSVDQSSRLYIRWCGTHGFQERSMVFYWPCCSLPFSLLLFSLSLLSFCRLVLRGWGIWINIGYKSLSHSLVMTIMTLLLIIMT